MFVNYYAGGKFYLISCPEESSIIRRSDAIVPGGRALPDLIIVPFGGRDIRIPTEPPELLPLLAETGRCGLSLVGEPRPDVYLEGAICPGCGESDVNWLCTEDDTGRIHCENCDGSFERGRGMIMRN